MATNVALLDRELEELDALELGQDRGRSRWLRVWSAAWPKLLAACIVLAAWQLGSR